MDTPGPGFGNVPSGATMQPRYMGRVMNTHPVSEPEMERISSLNALTTGFFSAATFLLGIAISIWVNAAFYKELTPLAEMATKFIAPFLLIFAVISAVVGLCAQWKRKGTWTQIKRESIPVAAIAPSQVMSSPEGAASAPAPA